MGQSNSTSRFEMYEKCIRHDRFAPRNNDFHLWDISLSTSGKIAVSCYNKKTADVFIDVYKLANNKGNQETNFFKKIPKSGTSRDLKRLHISFLCEADSEKIVMCNVEKIEILNIRSELTEHDRPKLNFKPSCLSVGEKRVFVGSQKSKQVIIFDYSLIQKRTINFKGPFCFYKLRDLAVIDERVFACTSSKLFSIDVKGTDSAVYPSEFCKMKKAISWWAFPSLIFNKFSRSSVTASKMFSLVASSWCKNRVALYPIEGAKPFLYLNLGYDVHSIKICEERKELVTANYCSGEIHFFDLEKLFSYSQMKECLQLQLTNRNCENLAHRLRISKEFIQRISKSKTPAKDLFLYLEEKHKLNEKEVGELAEQLKGISKYFYHIVDIYQKIHGLSDETADSPRRERPVFPDGGAIALQAFPLAPSLDFRSKCPGVNDQDQDEEYDQGSGDSLMIGCQENGTRIDSSQRCPRDSIPLTTFPRSLEDIYHKKMEEFCQEIAKKLGSEWKELGRALGLTTEKLGHIEKDNDCREEAIFAMLQKWRHKKGRNATFDALSEALKKAERCDLAEQALTVKGSIQRE